MNARIIAISLIALAALSAGLAACGGSSSGDKTKTAAAGTPTAGTTVSAGKTAGATSAAKTPGTSQTPGAAATTTGTAPDTNTAPPADVTVNAEGTATNSQGTPVPLPTTAPAGGSTPAAATPAPGTTEAAGATAQAVATPVPGSGPRISIDAPATASGDFSITVRLDGVAQPYTGFNIYLTFDASIADSTGGTAGTALANTPDEMFCAKSAVKIAGEEGLGCAILGGGITSTNNGVLATFNFQKKGSGTLRIHMRTFADAAPNGAILGTFLIDTNSAAFDVGLTDATVTLS